MNPRPQGEPLLMTLKPAFACAEYSCRQLLGSQPDFGEDLCLVNVRGSSIAQNAAEDRFQFRVNRHHLGNCRLGVRTNQRIPEFAENAAHLAVVNVDVRPANVGA